MIDTKALRQKILDMAIRGKLVPQNPNDEPASVLLERIRAEKQQLIKEGKIKKDKNDSVIFKGDDNRYYENLPCGWSVSTLSQVTSSQLLNDGDWILSENMDPNGNVKLIQLGSIGLMRYIDKGFKYLTEDTFHKLSCTQIFPGYMLINRIISDKMYACILPQLEGKLITTVDTCWIAPKDEWYNLKYLMYFISSTVFQSIVLHVSSGTTRKRISKSDLIHLPIYLPPLSEQQRIISRVDELFEQIDIIEKNKADIDALYDEFRKRTLTLAIQGKLVPQDPNDEPASVLIERIRAEKKAKLGKKYVDSYIYKSDDNCYYEKVGETVTNISDEIPFDLPENWAWCRLKAICSYIHRGKSPTYGTEKILPIIAQKCNQWAGLQTQKCLFADRATIAKYTEEQYLCVGDIIINSTGTGTVGRTGYIDDTLFKEYPKFVADSHVTVVRPLKCINSQYIYLFLKSPVIQTDIEAKCSGSTNQIELSTKTIQSYLIPIPPAMEQYRIVSRFFSLQGKLKDED